MTLTDIDVADTLARPPRLPDWVTDIRPHQQGAVDEIMEHYRSGTKVVFLDGPTGTGKTLIGEMVGRARATDPETYGGGARRSLYVCSDKQLQDQFHRDFPYSRVLKGRANYPTLDGGDGITADDCTSQGGSQCMWCSDQGACPYQVAKSNAIEADLAVVNTSYLLTEANLDPKVAKFSRQPFIIADEADMLEGALLNAIQYEVPQYVARDLRLQHPKKGVHKATLIAWLAGVEQAARQHLRDNSARLEVKQKRRWRSFAEATSNLQFELAKDTEAEGDDDGRWIRDYDTKTFKMVPVLVGRYGPLKLWRHGHNWLLMSATLISPDQMADELGLPWDFETVTVPMTFPVENRPIYLAGIANVTWNADEYEYEKLADAVAAICDRHPDERILVHTVSYRLNGKLMGLLRERVHGRALMTYENSQGKHDAIARYRKQHAAVLLAPSANRGVDLKDEDCRVMVIAKVPYPSFGDRRVAARTRLPGGQAWYAVQTVRDLVQMTGRGVRSEDDYAVTYVLDKQFMSNTWRRAKMLFPQWWRDAVDPSFNPRQLMRGRGE